MDFISGMNTSFSMGDTSQLSVQNLYIFNGKHRKPELMKLDSTTSYEQLESASVKLDVSGTIFEIPASWSIVVADIESSTVDTIHAIQASVYEFLVPGYSIAGEAGASFVERPTKHRAIGKNYSSTPTHFSYPSIPKNCAFLIRGNDGKTIITGPYDLHRYIGGLSIGDLYD